MKDFGFIDELGAQKSQVFLWAPVFFGVGVGIYFAMPSEPVLWLAVPLLAALFGFLVFLRERVGIFTFLLLLFLMAAGFAAAQVRTQIVYTPMLEKKIGPVEVRGRVVSVEQLEGKQGQRLLLEDVQLEKLAPEKTPVRVRVTMRAKKDEFRPGDVVKVLAQLNPPSPPVMPGGFDFQRYMFFQQIGAVGFVYKFLGNEGGAQERQFVNGIENLRNSISARMEKYLSPDVRAMAIALTTGQRGAISDDDNEAMRNSGLSHLISISGLHIGIFSAFVFFVLRFLMVLVPRWALHRPIKKYAAVFAFMAAAFYSVLAGFSIPTQRSLMMIGIAYLAIMLDRSPLSLRLVAFAALMVLLTAPESLITASFQMSFGAVAALILFFDFLRPYWVEWNSQPVFLRKAALYVGSICMTTIIATLATAPFSLFHFQQLALYGLPANALAVPLSTFVIMPAIVFTLLLMPLHLEFIPLYFLEESVRLLLWIAHYIDRLPYGVLYVAAWPQDVLPWMMAGVIFMCLWQGWFRLAGLLPILISLVLIAAYRPPDVLASPEFDLMAYRSVDGGLHVSGKRKNKFTIESWEKMYGLAPGSAQAWPKEGQEGVFGCDASACRLEMNNHKVSFLKRASAVPEECSWAEIVLSFSVVDGRPCGDVPLMDKLDGYREGAHALWLTADGIKIETAQQERGRRPWSE